MFHSFPTHISPDGRNFLDAQGQPFFWLGDTAWSLLTRYTPEEAKIYLENRARRGFTVIQCVVAWFEGSQKDMKGITANSAGEFPWFEGDPAQPNPRFFTQVDALLAYAEQLGLTLAVLPTWGNYVTDEMLFTPENAQTYGRWLGERYRNAPNLVWINGGDCLPHDFESVFDALGEGLREGDNGKHLITFHPCHLHSSSQYFNNRAWLDFHLIQVWTDWHKVYPSVLADALTPPRRPVVVGEGAYENGPEYPRGPITPLVVRRQAWWAFMAGGYYTYGQNHIWRASSNWLDMLDTTGAVQMGVFRQTVELVPWWERIPDQSIIEEGVGDGETLNAAIRAPDGRWVMLYLSSRTHVLVRLEKLCASRAHASWINPATGEQRDAGVYETYTKPGFRQVRTTHFQWFSTPQFWEDAILLLESMDEPTL